MLSDATLLDAVDLRVDFISDESSIAEHGPALRAVNKFELCAEFNTSLSQAEWWPMINCMFGLQACMTNDGEDSMMSCAEAESGSDDTLEIPGTDSENLDDCSCSLAGVVDYCSAKHTSATYDDLQACAESSTANDLFNASRAIANVANDGHPLWVTVNGVEYSGSTTETTATLQDWASDVKTAVCQALGTSAPAACTTSLSTTAKSPDVAPA